MILKEMILKEMILKEMILKEMILKEMISIDRTDLVEYGVLLSIRAYNLLAQVTLRRAG